MTSTRLEIGFKSLSWRLAGLLGAAVLLWLGLYVGIQPASEWLSYVAFGLSPTSQFGSAVAFFLYDVPKILLLLTGMIFVISLLQTFFSPERSRALLGGKREGLGNLMAAGLGILTPFCSCSAVPLFIGFVKSGVQMGVTFSFLIATPTINEVALVLLLGLFGWRIAGLYVLSGLLIAVTAGWIIGRLKLERFVEEFVWEIKHAPGMEGAVPTWRERVDTAWESVRQIVGRVWLYVILGIAIGAAIHGYVPTDALSQIMGKKAWWSVPAAVLMGVPLYSNAAGMIPLVMALMEKGASAGTGLAFMMSVVGLSLPEVIILRRVLKPPLLAVFVAVVTAAIILTGYLFNLVV
jgi:uncharacterized membrane protein YraQ (UPF0718 family)